MTVTREDRFTLGIEIVGLKDAIREIGQIDKEARKAITRKYRDIMKPVMATAKGMTPVEAPLSGMNRNWTSRSGYQLTPWSGRKAKTLIKTKINTKRPREYAGQVRDLAVFTISWNGNINTIFDLAGSATDNAFARNLDGPNSRGIYRRNPSRVMWASFDKHQTQIMTDMAALVQDVMEQTDRRIVYGK